MQPSNENPPHPPHQKNLTGYTCADAPLWLHTTPVEYKHDNFTSAPCNLKKVAGAKPAKFGFGVLILHFWWILLCFLFSNSGTLHFCALQSLWNSTQTVERASQRWKYTAWKFTMNESWSSTWTLHVKNCLWKTLWLSIVSWCKVCGLAVPTHLKLFQFQHTV